jgi:histone H1/5
VSNHPTIKFAQHSLRTALKKGAESGKLVKVKASFKLAESEKKAPKKVAAKKVAAPKAAAVKKSPAAKKG